MVEVVRLGAPPVTAVPESCRDRVTPGSAVTVGKSWDRASFTRARAARKFASAEATVWFETFTSSSNAFKFGSPNIFHHLPRAASSLGSAFFQPSISLKAAGVWTVGFAYFGAKLHPASQQLSMITRMTRLPPRQWEFQPGF